MELLQQLCSSIWIDFNASSIGGCCYPLAMDHFLCSARDSPEKLLEAQGSDQVWAILPVLRNNLRPAQGVQEKSNISHCPFTGSV